MKMYWGAVVWLRALNSAQDGGEWSASRPGRFTTGKEHPIPIGREAGWAPEPV